MAFAAIPVPNFGIVCARPLGSALPSPSVRVFLQSPHFNFVVAAGTLLDELCWGCGSAYSSDLEAALVQMVIAVGEDLESAMSRLRPMMSLVAGAAQESDHMLFQMKKDVASCLQNEHRSLALGRLHQFLDQLQNNGSEMSMMLTLPQSFKDASSAFFKAKTTCTPPAKFRQSLRDTLRAAQQLHAHEMSSSAAYQKQPCAALTNFISEASKLAVDAASPLSSAETDAAVLLKPKLLGARLPSLLFMPVLSIEDLQVGRVVIAGSRFE